MKKKVLSIALVSLMAAGLMAGCTPKENPEGGETTTAGNVETPAPAAGPVELNVVSTFGGDDGNRGNYEKAYKDWEANTGNTVKDASGKADEAFKLQVMNDFNVGAEPDVLFYFNGNDANPIVENNQVVSVDEIRAVYPDYASNMSDDVMATCVSPADGKLYAIPLIGYWEAMYVNKYVLDDCGVAVPGADYSWDQFMKDCETIKSKGYTPIAASIHNVPHYWFEFLIFNYTTPATHVSTPESVESAQGQAWVNGLNDFKVLMDAGYFPKNTTSASDDETAMLMLEDKAAFMIDGSWKRAYFEDGMGDKIDHITVTFPPSNGKGRKTTDLIGGISSGYYITRKCWESEKRDAAVDFVNYMTSTPVLSTFAAGNSTACKDVLAAPTDASCLLNDVYKMGSQATGYTGAVQDLYDVSYRDGFFNNIKNIATGNITAEDALASFLADYQAFNAE